MTTVKMNWGRMRLSVTGHAGGGDPGKDVICAAESILLQTLVESLERARQRGRVEIGYKMDDGDAYVWAEPGMGTLTEIKSYFRMCLNGYRLLAEEYPKNVKCMEVG